MRAVITSASSKPALSADSHSSVVTDFESIPAEIVEVPVKDEVAWKEAAACPFDPQTYRREEVGLTVFQVEEVRNPF